jgi:energy-coupling factor transporter ATP-binding protein EcfA2
MKVKELILRNYKGFGADAAPISFCDELGNVNPVTVLVGPNGSGKSSVLQAIAMLVGSASKRKLEPVSFQWPGFNLEYIGRDGKPPQMDLLVSLDAAEVTATSKLFDTLNAGREGLVRPASSREIRLHLQYPSRYDYRDSKVLAPSPPELFQLRGYEYALQLNGGDSVQASNLANVGGIYWYHDLRMANSMSRAVENDKSEGQIAISEDMMRSVLQRWTGFHDMIRRPGFELRDHQIDRFLKLKNLYSSVFPDREIIGSIVHPSPERQFEPSPFWFKDRSGAMYELSAMSAGERAIFPILMDFATWVMKNSIILIDELELHLHPPLQQALVRALPKLGENNQFIITSHSDHVVRMFPESRVIRLKS